MAKQKPKQVTKTMYRNAENGRIVSKEYAEKNPKTTTKEIRRIPK